MSWLHSGLLLATHDLIDLSELQEIPSYRLEGINLNSFIQTYRRKCESHAYLRSDRTRYGYRSLRCQGEVLIHRFFTLFRSNSLSPLRDPISSFEHVKWAPIPIEIVTKRDLVGTVILSESEKVSTELCIYNLFILIFVFIFDWLISKILIILCALPKV